MRGGLLALIGIVLALEATPAAAQPATTPPHPVATGANLWNEGLAAGFNEALKEAAEAIAKCDQAAYNRARLKYDRARQAATDAIQVAQASPQFSSVTVQQAVDDLITLASGRIPFPLFAQCPPRAQPPSPAPVPPATGTETGQVSPGRRPERGELAALARAASERAKAAAARCDAAALKLAQAELNILRRRAEDAEGILWLTRRKDAARAAREEAHTIRNLWSEALSLRLRCPETATAPAATAPPVQTGGTSAAQLGADAPSIGDRVNAAHERAAAAAERCDQAALDAAIAELRQLLEAAREALAIHRATPAHLRAGDAAATTAALAAMTAEMALESALQMKAEACPPKPPGPIGSLWQPGGQSLIAAVGLGTLEIPTTGIGFFRETSASGSERFAGTGSDSLSTMSVSAKYGWRAGPNLTAIASYQGLWGDEKKNWAVTPASGGAAGFVYGDNAPSGSSGVNLGARAVTGTFATHASIHNFKLKMMMQDWGEDDDGPPPLRSRFTFYGYVDLLHTSREYEATGLHQSSSLTVSQTRMQELDEYYFGLGVGVLHQAPVTDRFRIISTVSLTGFHRSSELNSRERNVCSFCSSSDADFTLGIDDEDDGFTFAVAGGLYAEYRLNERLSIGAGVDAAYLDEVGGVFNPHSGDQVFFENLSTRLNTDSAVSYNARVGLNLRF